MVSPERRRGSREGRLACSDDKIDGGGEAIGGLVLVRCVINLAGGV